MNRRSGVSGQHQNEEELNGKRREVSTERSQKQNFSQLGRSPGDFVKEPSPNLFGTRTGFSTDKEGKSGGEGTGGGAGGGWVRRRSSGELPSAAWVPTGQDLVPVRSPDLDLGTPVIKDVCFLINISSFKSCPLLGTSEAACGIKPQSISRPFFSSFPNKNNRQTNMQARGEIYTHFSCRQEGELNDQRQVV